MSLDALTAIEQHITHIGQRHPGFPVEFSMVVRLIKLLNWHVTSAGNAVLKTWGITYTEYSVLTMLYGHPGHIMSAQEMSDAIGESSSYTNRLIVLLDSRGLVIRSYDEEDRRKVVATLSHAGLQLIQNLLPVVSGLVNDIVRSFAPGEMAELVRLLKQSLKGIAA